MTATAQPKIDKVTLTRKDASGKPIEQTTIYPDGREETVSFI